MYAKIDWYSWMDTIQPLGGSVGEGGLDFVLTNFGWTHPIDAFARGMHNYWETFPGRGAFKERWHNAKLGLDISPVRNSNDIKCDLSGLGCDMFRKYSDFQMLLGHTHLRCSRIDLAIDIDASSPLAAERLCHEIATQTRAATTLKSLSEVHSPSGDTFYFGSWDSERFARCYHFKEPHPRANFVRLEAVYKGRWAKRLLANGRPFILGDLVKTAHDAYKWKVIDLELVGNTIPGVSLPRSDKSGGGHTRWLLLVCVPALRKALNEGEISEEYLMHEIFIANSAG